MGKGHLWLVFSLDFETSPYDSSCPAAKGSKSGRWNTSNVEASNEDFGSFSYQNWMASPTTPTNTTENWKIAQRMGFSSQLAVFRILNRLKSYEFSTRNHWTMCWETPPEKLSEKLLQGTCLSWLELACTKEIMTGSVHERWIAAILYGSILLVRTKCCDLFNMIQWLTVILYKTMYPSQLYRTNMIQWLFSILFL
jgi:hypothetical protein